LVLVDATLAIVGPSAILVVAVESPAPCAEFSDTAHEVVRFEEHLFAAVLAIATPHKRIVQFLE
jgi:hypothetical protein